MEALQVLEEIFTQKDLSKDKRKRAVTALLELSGDINNAKQVAEYLMKLHYSACPEYFNRAVPVLSDEQLSAIVEAFRLNEQFQKDKPQNFLYPKGFGSALSLAKFEKYQLSFLILNYVLLRSEKNSKFSDGCKNGFKKAVIDQSELPVIQRLFEVINAEAFEAKPFEKRRFERFLESVTAKTIPRAVESDTVTQQCEQQKKEEVPIAASKKEPSIHNAGTTFSQSEISKIESIQTEILSALRRLAENRNAIDTLALQLQKKDDEISTAYLIIKEKDQQLGTVLRELKKSKEALSDAEAQITDLTARLRTSLNMDEISKNQELATLKNDVSEALKLDYSDFIDTKSSDYSQDLFEAYRSTLTRIFKLLKRFGITCD